jgi:hypothetical protein
LASDVPVIRAVLVACNGKCDVDAAQIT